jgi:hypothetical protein
LWCAKFENHQKTKDAFSMVLDLQQKYIDEQYKAKAKIKLITTKTK